MRRTFCAMAINTFLTLSLIGLEKRLENVTTSWRSRKMCNSTAETREKPAQAKHPVEAKYFSIVREGERNFIPSTFRKAKKTIVWIIIVVGSLLVSAQPTTRSEGRFYGFRLFCCRFLFLILDKRNASILAKSSSFPTTEQQEGERGRR